MEAADYDVYAARITQGVHDLATARYGRSADTHRTGLRLTVVEAGYALTGGWWSTIAALEANGTTFNTVESQARMSVLIRDLLRFPHERADDDWAHLYGFSCPSAASRALRSRFEVGLGEVRAMGVLGEWLGHEMRQPRRAGGIERKAEAHVRLRSFQNHILNRHRDPELEDLLNELRAGRSNGGQRRPRYPAISGREQHRLARSTP